MGYTSLKLPSLNCYHSSLTSRLSSAFQDQDSYQDYSRTAARKYWTCRIAIKSGSRAGSSAYTRIRHEIALVQNPNVNVFSKVS